MAQYDRNQWYTMLRNRWYSMTGIVTNPTNGNFTVSFSEYSNTPNKILICDFTGKTVWSDENVEAKEKRINLENVSKGIYILKINSNEHLYCYKISII